MADTKKYRPANGTEGMAFMACFCDRCQHGRVEGGCDIAMNTLLFNVDDPEYPAEWTFDADGDPTCTAFEATPDGHSGNQGGES